MEVGVATMTIELTPEMEAIVTEQLNTGRYASASAVIEEALQAVQGGSRGLRPLSQAERDEKALRMIELFAEIDAAGGIEFELDRDMRPAEEREPW